MSIKASQSGISPYKTFSLSICLGLKKFWLPIFLIISACEDFVQVEPPPNQIVSSAGFSDDATAIASIRGIYSEMNNGTTIANFAVALYGGLSADEFRNHSSSQNQVDIHENSIHPTNGVVASLWNNAYKFIYYANSVLETLQNSPNVSALTRTQLEGEARFIRAYCHFYLVNLFGDIPYVKTTDYRLNSLVSRNTVAEVYANLIVDLKEAELLLSENYITQERVRPNKWVVTALLARVYLYSEDWANAESHATSLINNSAIYRLEELNSTFIKESKEVIWQLMPIRSPVNSAAAGTFVVTFLPNVDLTQNFLDSFEAGDKRRDSWVGSTTNFLGTFYFPYKYKVSLSVEIVEYDIIFRLGEQYLLRAEARAKQNKISEAIADLDVIRNRAGLPLVADSNPGLDQEQFLLIIEHERKIELMSEGHRWLDLKRTHRADNVLAIIKPEWQSTDILYPIPQPERNNNPNLSQNPGYDL